MEETVGELSYSARKIFENLKPYFPSDPWNNPCWKPEGLVNSNGWHDLRKREDRERLIDQEKQSLGYQVFIEATLYRKNHGCVPRGELGWMTDFEHHHIARSMQHGAELLLLLLDLDFQIQTLDLLEI